ncbi:hypothetical protein FRC03_010750 [Tulasnella sp. 419]|nr:hypothetical protein FRC03_010750 [Tulasnella sp. 419]
MSPAGLLVISHYCDRFISFVKAVAKKSHNPHHTLVRNNVVLGLNLKAVKDHLLITQTELDPSDLRAIESAQLVCDLLSKPYAVPPRRLRSEIESAYKSIRDLGIKYSIQMDWSSYEDTVQCSNSPPNTSSITPPRLQPEQISSETSRSEDFTLKVLICLWDRTNAGPDTISNLDNPSYQTDRTYAGSTPISRLLMDLEEERHLSFSRRIQCYSLKDEDHSYTVPGLRWSPREDSRKIASLSKFEGITTIHIIQDTYLFLLFVLYVQPSFHARGIVVGMEDENKAHIVEEYINRGLGLRKGAFHYQEIEGDYRLQLTGCRLVAFSCDWCIIHGRPRIRN